MSAIELLSDSDDGMDVSAPAPLAQSTGVQPRRVHQRKQGSAAPSRRFAGRNKLGHKIAARIDLAAIPAAADYGAVLSALESLPIPINRSRKNIRQDTDQVVTGMCLGVVNSRCMGIVVSKFARDRPN